MTKIYKKLTLSQRLRGVVYSSQFKVKAKGKHKQDGVVYEVFKYQDNQFEVISELRKDDAYSNSIWNYNVIRS